MQRILFTFKLLLCSGIVLADFDPDTDLISLHFDNAPDRGDIHSSAASLMVVDDFGIEPVVINGTYGTQNEDQYLSESGDIIEEIWLDNWIDAAVDRQIAIEETYSVWLGTLENGGDIWIAEGGSSDLTAGAVRLLQADGFDTANTIHVVQHSQQNEDNSDIVDLAFVMDNTDYIRIDDGKDDNGTADFAVDGGSALFVKAMLNSDYSYEWELAFEHLDPEERLDFSDTVSLLHIVGIDKNEVANTTQFANRFTDSDISDSDDTTAVDDSSENESEDDASDTEEDTTTEDDSASDEGSTGPDTSNGNTGATEDDITGSDEAVDDDTSSDTEEATEENVTTDQSGADNESATEDEDAIEDGTTNENEGATEDEATVDDSTIDPDTTLDDEDSSTEGSDSVVDEPGTDDNNPDEGDTTNADETVNETDSNTSGEVETNNSGFVEFGVQLPACTFTDSDSDGDGYGWEQNSSCVVPGSGIITVFSFPVCESPLSDSDGDGWGWENNTSCFVVTNN